MALLATHNPIILHSAESQLPQGIHSTLRLSTTCDQRCGNHTPFRKCVKCQKAKDSRLSARYLYPPVAASLNEIVGGEKSQSQKVKSQKVKSQKVKKSIRIDYFRFPQFRSTRQQPAGINNAARQRSDPFGTESRNPENDTPFRPQVVLAHEPE